jgi:NADPH-dependent curcumin reductase
MTAFVNRQILLTARPTAEAQADNFTLVEAPVPVLTDGQVLMRNHYLSLDPYMRGRMNEGKSYAQPQPLNAVMQGGTVGEIVESKNGHFQPGDKVVGSGGWQEYTVVDATQRGVLRKVDTAKIPLSAYLGAVGMPGVTAWYGLVRLINPKAGETVVVSAASGAVGGAVGQLAKARGARAVGIAGGPDKCRYVVEELGFDACVDYKTFSGLKELSAALNEACPKGIDGYFENVGGVILDAVMRNANAFSRIALCGLISSYEGAPIPMAAPQLLLVNRMKLEGFIITEHMEVWPDALGELGSLVASGKLKYRETVAEGLASAPDAFIGLLKGKNFGKQLVKLV